MAPEARTSWGAAGFRFALIPGLQLSHPVCAGSVLALGVQQGDKQGGSCSLCLDHPSFTPSFRDLFNCAGFIFRQASLMTVNSNFGPTSDKLRKLKGKESLIYASFSQSPRANSGLTWVMCPSLSQSLSPGESKAWIGQC